MPVKMELLTQLLSNTSRNIKWHSLFVDWKWQVFSNFLKWFQISSYLRDPPSNPQATLHLPKSQKISTITTAVMIKNSAKNQVSIIKLRNTMPLLFQPYFLCKAVPYTDGFTIGIWNPLTLSHVQQPSNSCPISHLI